MIIHLPQSPLDPSGPLWLVLFSHSGTLNIVQQLVCGRKLTDVHPKAAEMLVESK